MISNTDQAWAEMKSPTAEKYAWRVKQVLSGSADHGRKAKAVGFSAQVFNQVRVTRHDEPTGQGEQERITSTDTRSAHDVASSLLASWQKNKNGAADGDVRTRKAAMQSLSRDIHAVVQQFGSAPILAQSAPSSGPQENAGTFLEEVMAILMEALAKVMFKGLADRTEACREASIQAVTLFVEHVSDLTPHLAYLFPILMARGVPAGSLYDPSLEVFVHDNDEHEAYKRGRATERQDHQLPLAQRVAEGSEELRLSLCRMVGRMLVTLMDRGTVGVLRPYLDDTILLLVSQCRDPYSTVTVEAMSIVTKLVVHPHLEQGMKFYAVGLSRAILPHLRHRHAKVRLAAIQALRMTVKVPDRAKVKGAGTSAIVDLVGFREDNVLPVAAFYGRGDTTVNYLAELTTDRSVSVRTETTAMLGDWLTTLPDRYDHQTRLLPYVLNAIADDAKVVSAIALETLSKCGAEYEREHQDDIIERRQFGVDGDIRANHNKPLPRPFAGRPRIGARLYVRKNTRRFLLPLLEEMSNWISTTRLQSALLFRTLVVYCEEHLTVETHKLIPHLQRALHLAISAKDKLLEKTLLQCCELVGRYVAPESYLPHMLSRVKEELDVNPTGSRATLLLILWKLMEGSLPKVLAPHTPEIIDAVTGRIEDIAAEAGPVREAAIKVLFVATNSMGGRGRQTAEEVAFANTGRLASMARPIKSALAYLLACRSLAISPADVDKSLRSLAAASDVESVESLVSAHAEKLVESVCEGFPVGSCWTRTCCPQLVLEALLAVCPQAIHCIAVVPRLLRLCQQVVSKLENFPDDDQEQVLTTLVGALLLRIVNVWECNKDPSGINEPRSEEDSTRCMLDLILNSCWTKNPALRQRQMEIISVLMARQTWRPSEDMLAALSDHLEHLKNQEQECCEILSLVSHVIRTRSDAYGNSLRVTPFARREKIDEPSESFSKLAALAFPLILAKIENSSDSVCMKPIQTLGGFLPLIQPDRTGSERPCSFASTSPTVASGRVSLNFGVFVEKCVMRCASLTSTSDKLDTLLRRAACLDPKAFCAVLERISTISGLSTGARQWISDLADHGHVLETLTG